MTLHAAEGKRAEADRDQSSVHRFLCMDDPNLKKTARAEMDAKSVFTPEKDAQVREGIATADGLVRAKITPLSETGLGEAAESRAAAGGEVDAASLRERADALGELAQQTQGRKRNELLDEADKLDVLAEAREKAQGLDGSDLPAKDETPASAAPVGDTKTSTALANAIKSILDG